MLQCGVGAGFYLVIACPDRSPREVTVICRAGAVVEAQDRLQSVSVGNPDQHEICCKMDASHEHEGYALRAVAPVSEFPLRV
jgi:hypothetical protein